METWTEKLTKILPYIPVIVVFITAILAYVSAMRTKKIDRFYDLVKINVNEIGWPILSQLRAIKRESNSKEKLKLLKQFIEKQSGETSKLSMFGNHYQYEWYFMMEELYYAYLKSPTDQSWNKLWASFGDFYLMFKNELQRNRNALFHHYDWFQRLSESNFLVRAISEIVRVVYAIMNVVMAILILCYLGIGYDRILAYLGGPALIPTDIWDKYWLGFVIISLLFLILWSLTLMVASGIGYLHSGRLRLEKTGMEKYRAKKFPRLYRNQSEYTFQYNQKKLNRVNERMPFPEFVLPDQLKDEPVPDNKGRQKKGRNRRR